MCSEMVRKSERVHVCVRERTKERKSVFVCVLGIYVCVLGLFLVSMCISESLFVCEREKERVYLCVLCEREREREFVDVCVLGLSLVSICI